MGNKRSCWFNRLFAWGIIVAVFALGVALGVYIQKKINPQILKTETAKSFYSSVVSSITAYGKITKIEGKTITLENLGSSLPILIGDNAHIYSFAMGTVTGTTTPVKKPVQKEIAFTDIKIGNGVNVIVKIMPDGQMQGSSVIVLSQ